MHFVAEFKPRLPPELVRHVAGFCTVSSVQSLVLLNKHFYLNIISILYEMVHITSTGRLFDFSRTLSERPSLRLFTRSLRIVTKDHPLTADIAVIQDSIRNLFLVVENVSELALDLRNHVIYGLFDHSSLESVTFRLKHLV
ncbi:hypothetical protein FRC08_006928 [Ceratobasidium sp. 394]|nr:hypothetical protein FRC08_006928 [Ceratobasidium sp. 394]